MSRNHAYEILSQEVKDAMKVHTDNINEKYAKKKEVIKPKPKRK